MNPSAGLRGEANVPTKMLPAVPPKQVRFRAACTRERLLDTAATWELPM